jgi:hypothetical protein
MGPCQGNGGEAGAGCLRLGLGEDVGSEGPRQMVRCQGRRFPHSEEVGGNRLKPRGLGGSGWEVWLEGGGV